MRTDQPAQRNNSSGSEVSLEIPPNAIYNTSRDCIVQNDDDSNGKTNCCTTTMDWLKQTSANIFRKKTLYKRLPILTWLPKYDRNDFIGDLMAGITVGLTVIPQGLAYAGIAGLDLQVSWQCINISHISVLTAEVEG